MAGVGSSGYHTHTNGILRSGTEDGFDSQNKYGVEAIYKVGVFLILKSSRSVFSDIIFMAKPDHIDTLRSFLTKPSL